MSINFTTARDLVETKIRRNIAIIHLLNAESDILKKNILISYRMTENNQKNIVLIEEINKIEAEQTQTYCQTRETAIKNLTERVNNNKPDIKTLYEDINVLKNKCYAISIQIKNLNDQIPDQTIVANYSMPIKMDNCRN